MNIKLSTVGKLTRYISPKEIEHARYKKFNCPKTEFDGMDEFFRQDELFIKGKDEITHGYMVYDTEDLPVYYSDQFDKDLIHWHSQLKPFIELRHVTPYIKLIKNGQIISDEDILSRGTRDYTVNNLISEKVAEGFSTEEICNVLYSARTNGVIRPGFAREAFGMLNEGYPLNEVIRLMEKSKMKFHNGISKYSDGMLDFLKKFPHLKKAMITKDFMGDDAFDKSGAKLFPKIYDIAPDEKTALKVIIDCRTTEKDGSRYTQPSLAQLAMELIKKHSFYTNDDSKLIKSIKYSEKDIDNKSYKAINRVHDDVSSRNILELMHVGRL